MICAFEDCDRPVQTKGYCKTHYLQLWRGQDLTPIKPRNRKRKEGCDFPGCDQPHVAKGLCGGHYAQLARGEDLREFEPIAKHGEAHTWLDGVLSSPETDECIEWPFGTGNKGKEPSGPVINGEKTRPAHYILEQSGFPRPPAPNDYALHSCDNRFCVNLKHLRWGSPKENAEDMMERGRHATQKHEKLIGWLDEHGIQFPNDLR